VIFEGSARVSTAGLCAKVEKAIGSRFGFRVPITFRSEEQLEKAVRGNPFLNEHEDFLHVVFLADLPGAAAVKSLDPARSPGDRFHVSGQEITFICRMVRAKQRSRMRGWIRNSLL